MNKKKYKARQAKHLGHRELPDAVSDGFDTQERILCKFAVITCENGGKVITTERFDKPSREHHYKVYQVPENGDLMATLATILVEERLK